MRYHLLLPALVSAPLFGHPMGNFSVSHYAGFEITRGRTNVKYVLDLAEIPTMELLRDWKLGRTSPRADLEEKVAAQGREWAGQLQVDVNGKRVNPTFERAELVIADGAGNLPILRITSYLHIDAAPGRLEYEDLNYAGRAGWKEIVIRGGKGAVIRSASQGSDDRSKALTEYPRDPTIAPPQDLRAAIDWRAVAPAGLAIQAAPVIQPVGQPANAPAAAAPATMTANAAPAGAVVKGDFLSRLLHQREITLGMTLIAMLVAFALGAAHALTPGHGKTIVAAYLVGSRGTLKHAAFLGAMVTFTHTISVFLLGLVTLFLFQYVMPEKITQVLGVVSGMSIVVIGGWMLYKRTRSLRRGHDHNHHGHDHGHEHHHHHDGHVHSHDHGHHHEHDHAHCHDQHQHVPDEISWGGLVALGASGGLVPCESALVLLLSAIALGRVGLGLTLLVAFSLGLAIVLMGIGVLVLYAKHLIPEGKTSSLSFLRWMPVASGALVLSIGLLMTAVSVGWLAPRWMLG